MTTEEKLSFDRDRCICGLDLSDKTAQAVGVFPAGPDGDRYNQPWGHCPKCGAPIPLVGRLELGATVEPQPEPTEPTEPEVEATEPIEPSESEA